MKEDFVKPIAVVAIICLVVSAALALTNGLTAPMIEEASEIRTQIAMRAIIPEATGFVRIENDGFSRAVKDAYVSENDIGYVFIVSRNGFSGEIRVICGVDKDGNIIGCSTLSHTETKGLGDFLKEDWWTSQFDGKDSRLEGINTITGATISSTAFMNAIREVFIAFELVRGA